MHRFRSFLGVVVAIFACALLTTKVSALEFSNSGVYGINANNSYINFPQASGLQSQRFYAVGYGAEVIPSTDLQTRRLGAVRIYSNVAIPSHSVFNVSGLVCGSQVNTSYNGWVGGSNFAIIDQNSTATDGDCLTFSVTGVTGNSAVSSLDFGFNDNSGSYFWFFGTGGKLAVQPISWLQIKEGSVPNYSSDLSSILSALDTLRLQNNDIYNVLTSLNSAQSISNDRLDILRIQNNDIYTAITNIRDLLGSTNTAIDNQTQAMNDIHEDEVNRIEGGVEDGKSEAEGMDTSLNPVNPITWLFSGLEVRSCYDISQLAAFVGAPSNTYCSWFGQGIRDIVSPVINLFATIVIIGFAYSWLKKGGL